MDEGSKKEFDRITAKSAESLTEEEVSFLFARRSYLTKTQREDFGDVLKKREAQVKEDETKEK